MANEYQIAIAYVAREGYGDIQIKPRQPSGQSRQNGAEAKMAYAEFHFTDVVAQMERAR